jgi:hypothetical protein
MECPLAACFFVQWTISMPLPKQGQDKFDPVWQIFDLKFNQETFSSFNIPIVSD